MGSHRGGGHGRGHASLQAKIVNCVDRPDFAAARRPDFAAARRPASALHHARATLTLTLTLLHAHAHAHATDIAPSRW